MAAPFVEGLIDEILSELPLGVRASIIFNWAEEFSTATYIPDPAIVEIIGTITTLDLSHLLTINTMTFSNLTSMPFSENLAHINLSETLIGESPVVLNTLSHPIFQYLVTLNLTNAKLPNINFLLDAQHTFNKLHTLNLSKNKYEPLWSPEYGRYIPQSFSIPTIATTTKFPNLKVLDISHLELNAATIKAFAMDETTTNTAPFQLEKLFLQCSTLDTTALPSLSHSPHLSQLRELDLGDHYLSRDTINKLFDPQSNVLKNLTHLHLGLAPSLHCSALPSIGQSPLLANLVSLEVECFFLPMLPREAAINSLLVEQFIDSSFLWSNPQLKHLALKGAPDAFQFDCLSRKLDKANVKLEKLDLSGTKSSLHAIATSSCLSNLKHLTIGEICDPVVFEPDHEGGDMDGDEDDEDEDDDDANGDEDGDDANGDEDGDGDEDSDQDGDEDGDDHGFKAFIKSPVLSNLITLNFKKMDSRSAPDWTPRQLTSLLSSPKMSNDLIEFDLEDYQHPVKDVIKTLCTQRVDPNDETSPLKFGKLRKLNLSKTDADDDDLELVIKNISQLTHLSLVPRKSTEDEDDPANSITDKTITALLASERTDPRYPNTSLPNLVHLNLSGSAISTNGFIQLSQSQLLDQLKSLDVRGCESLCPDNWEEEFDEEEFDEEEFDTNGEENTPDLPPGLVSLLSTPLVSNLRQLHIGNIILRTLYDLETQESASVLKYLRNCCLS